MTFNSIAYALFLPVVLAVFWSLPRSPRRWWLLGASYVFYGAWDWRFALLLAFTTVVDYNVAKVVERTDERSRRLRWLWVSVGTNLVVLGFFKYYGFFVESFAGLVARVGLEPSLPALQILLPVGISFYTFQSIGYSVDVYRRRVPACREPVTFATFVAYFPQLVAGPISRAEHLIPQLSTSRPRPRASQLASGSLLILLGLFRKVVLADAVAPVVARGFGATPGAGTALTVTAIVAFAIQIYADFAGYTDIARGSSRLFGIELVHNFDQPYLSRNVTEFWRRWHVSLSRWLRDYLYIPLGGSRISRGRTYANLMTTMVLGGLWHGAAWTFVAWGALNGLYLCIDRARGAPRDLADGLPRAREAPAIVGTFAVTCLAWVFFRSTSMTQAFEVVRHLCDPGGVPPPVGDVALVAIAAVTVVVIDLLQRAVRHPLGEMARRPYLTAAGVGVALVAVVVFSGRTPVPFIYFQF